MWFFSAVNSASAFFQIQLLLIIFSLAWKIMLKSAAYTCKKKSKILVWINVKKCSFARKCILQRTKLAIAHLLTAFIWLRAAKFFKNHHSQIFEKNKLTSFKRQVGRKKPGVMMAHSRLPWLGKFRGGSAKLLYSVPWTLYSVSKTGHDPRKYSKFLFIELLTPG